MRQPAGGQADGCAQFTPSVLPPSCPHIPLPPAVRSYSYENAPIQKELAATEVGSVATFLCSPLASAGEQPT